MCDAAMALRKIAERKATFVSRGDDSGTHTKEQALWRATGLPLRRESVEIVKKHKKQSLYSQHPVGLGQWYHSIGQGMGKTLTYAEEKQAYTLADRGTYLSMKEMLDLVICVEGDERLFNPYGVIAVNPALHLHAKYEAAMLFIAFLTSPAGQELIGNFEKNGEILFYPDAS